MTRRVLRDMFLVAGARYASEALFLLRGFVLARLLSPAAFGVWAAVRIVLLLAGHGHLGALHGVLQLSPLAAGAGHHARSVHYRRVAAAFGLLGSGVVALLLACFALLVPGHGTWLIVAGLVVTGAAFTVHVATLQCRQRFGAAASSVLAVAVLSTAGGIAAATRWGLPGFLAALGLAHLVVVAAGRSIPRPVFHRAAAGRLLRTGSPILAAEAVNTLLWNVDKILLWILASKTALGIYAVQSYATAGLMLLPGCAGVVLRPHLAHQVGLAGGSGPARRCLLRVAPLVACLTPPLLALLYLVFPLPIRWWLPAYEGAIAPGRILVLASFFPVAAVVPSAVLVTLNAQRRLLAPRAAGVALSAAAVSLVLWRGGSLAAVATGTALGLAVASALTVTAAMRTAGAGSPGRFLALLAAPGLATVPVAWMGAAALPLSFLPILAYVIAARRPAAAEATA